MQRENNYTASQIVRPHLHSAGFLS